MNNDEVIAQVLSWCLDYLILLRHIVTSAYMLPLHGTIHCMYPITESNNTPTSFIFQNISLLYTSDSTSFFVRSKNFVLKPPFTTYSHKFPRSGLETTREGSDAQLKYDYGAVSDCGYN